MSENRETLNFEMGAGTAFNMCVCTISTQLFTARGHNKYAEVRAVEDESAPSLELLQLREL